MLYEEGNAFPTSVRLENYIPFWVTTTETLFKKKTYIKDLCFNGKCDLN